MSEGYWATRTYEQREAIWNREQVELEKWVSQVELPLYGARRWMDPSFGMLRILSEEEYRAMDGMLFA